MGTLGMLDQQHDAKFERRKKIWTWLIIAILVFSVGGFLIGFGMAQLLGFSGVARGVLILQCAMPVAVFNYLLAQRYDRSPEQVASVVVVSTLLTAVTLPLLLPFVI